MHSRSGIWKTGAQGFFYLAILALIISNSVSAGISHDENQFIAAGQLLAYDGLLPYADYPYTHMPYGALFFSISALISDYDYLAGRILSCLAWFGSILMMVVIARTMRRTAEPAGSAPPSWSRLLWEFALVYVFVNHGPVLFVLGTALNHSLATLLTLAAVWCVVRAFGGQMRPVAAAAFSGVFVAAAGLTRFNYASLAVVLLGCWMIHDLWQPPTTSRRALPAYIGGGLAASLPALILFALARREFYYGNLVYIRLNTVYYRELLRRSGMDLASKLDNFVNGILVQPLDALLYLLLLYTIIVSIVRVVRGKSAVDLGRLAIAGVGVTLWLSAFAPTPTLLHYFAAPVPFLFILLLSQEFRLGRWATQVRVAGALLVLLAALASIRLADPIEELSVLLRPSTWHPVDVHRLSIELQKRVAAGGRVLTLQPMIALEAGRDVYAFTANGPFSWRTSLLLTAERRAAYGVISPEELPELLDQTPPDAILVGFEAPNAGFERQQLGGLEIPFSDYAAAHGFEPIPLAPSFWVRGVILWIKP